MAMSLPRQCDEAWPVCKQCSSRGRVCSGPRRDRFFVHAVAADAPVHARVDANLPRSVRQDQAYDQLFFAHFFDWFGRCPETLTACSWLAKVPAIIARSSSLPNLQYAFRATCMVFYGRSISNLDVQVEALTWYHRALRAQQRTLAATSTSVSGAGFGDTRSEQVICATLIMSYFELVVKSSEDAWMQHMDAASALLSHHDADLCNTSYPYQLFRSARLGAICSSVLRRTPHRVATAAWSAARYQQHDKIALDYVLDVIECLPSLLAQHAALPSTGAARYKPGIQIKIQVAALLRRLAKWMNHFVISDDTDSYQDDCSDTSANHTPALENVALLVPLSRLTAVLPSTSQHVPFTLLSCIFAAACVVCYGLLSSLEPENDLFSSLARDHCEEILLTTSELDQKRSAPVSDFYILATFPLRVVAAWSPLPEHIAVAEWRTTCPPQASALNGSL